MQRSHYREDENIRADMTNKQQNKLINFLHAKMDEKKKKRTISKFFAGDDKENNTPCKKTPMVTPKVTPMVTTKATPSGARNPLDTEILLKSATLGQSQHPDSVPREHMKLYKSSSTLPRKDKTKLTVEAKSSVTLPQATPKSIPSSKSKIQIPRNAPKIPPTPPPNPQKPLLSPNHAPQHPASV